MKTSLGIWAFGAMSTRFVPGGYQLQRAGESTAVKAVERSMLQWRFIDFVASRINDAALAPTQLEQDAVRAYEPVYAALGA